MRFELYTDAALSRDIPEHRLRRGDVVKVVDHHPSPNGESGYSIEVFNAVGDTIAVTAVPESALEPLHKNEILSVRALAAKWIVRWVNTGAKKIDAAWTVSHATSAWATATSQTLRPSARIFDIRSAGSHLARAQYLYYGRRDRTTRQSTPAASAAIKSLE